jgi:hypothetical protein
MSPAGINQAICAGGMGAWPAITRWLRQKLPNAIVVQDQELEVDRDIFDLHNSALNSVFQITNFSGKIGFSCLRVGEFCLSIPQILDVSQQQYSDFFLLWELMQVLGAQTLSFQEILQLLEGIGREYPHLRAPDSADFGRKIAGGSCSCGGRFHAAGPGV